MDAITGIRYFMQNLDNERLLLFLTATLAIIFYLMTLSLNSTYDDNLSYLNIGKELTKSGEYTGNFWIRPPIVPLFIAFLFILGLNIVSITIIFPLFFIILFLFANYFLFKTLYNRNLAILVAWVIMALPDFWRWSERVLVDTPLGAFAIISILFFYLGVEKDKKYLIPSSFFAAVSFLTKISAVALVFIFMAYLIYRKKWEILRTNEFYISLIIGILLPVAVIVYLFISDYSIFSLETIYFVLVPQGKDYVIKFLLNPLFLFVPLGLIRSLKERKKEHVLMLITIIIFLLGFINTATLMRYLTVLYGPILFLSVFGLLWMNKGNKGKLIVGFLFISSILVGLINTVYILEFVDSSTRYGVLDATSFLEMNTAQDERIAAGNLAGYIATYTSMNVISFPYYVNVENETTLIEEFNKIVTDPNHELYEKYVSLARKQEPNDYYYFDDKWVEENRIDYIVWSVYDEFLLRSEGGYYNIKYAGIELPIKRSYHALHPPPDYELSSELFMNLETSKRYKKERELLKEGQKIIVVYSVNDNVLGN